MNVVQIYYTATVYEALNGPFNTPLKCGWCITQSKWHHQVFISTVFASEGSFPLISLFNLDVVVASLMYSLVKYFAV